LMYPSTLLLPRKTVVQAILQSVTYCSQMLRSLTTIEDSIPF
jgi:hypothetical protein